MLIPFYKRSFIIVVQNSIILNFVITLNLSYQFIFLVAVINKVTISGIPILIFNELLSNPTIIRSNSQLVHLNIVLVLHVSLLLRCNRLSLSVHMHMIFKAISYYYRQTKSTMSTPFSSRACSPQYWNTKIPQPKLIYPIKN